MCSPRVPLASPVPCAARERLSARAQPPCPPAWLCLWCGGGSPAGSRRQAGALWVHGGRWGLEKPAGGASPAKQLWAHRLRVPGTLPSLCPGAEKVCSTEKRPRVASGLTLFPGCTGPALKCLPVWSVGHRRAAVAGTDSSGLPCFRVRTRHAAD